MPASVHQKPASRSRTGLHPIEALLYGASMILAGACFAMMGGLPALSGLIAGALAAVAFTTSVPAVIKDLLTKKTSPTPAPAAAAPAAPVQKNRWTQALQKLFNRTSKPAAAAPQVPAPAPALASTTPENIPAPPKPATP